LAFKPEDKQSRDSSSNAISACGLMIAASEDLYPDAMLIARGLVKSLVDGYTSRGMVDEDGILLHGVYAYAHGKGIDQANLWGDYYYMEALMRLNDAAWKAYW
jgi:unsaturated chondroitin disaccharide hydrolase